MKRMFYLFLLGVAMPFGVCAQNVRAMSDAEQLGMFAGWAMACGSTTKLEDFELIASRILANQSPSDEIEKKQVRIYSQAKWDALNQQKKGNQADCTEILEHFDQLPLFNSTVYGDGSVKLPDGTWSRPLRPVKR